MKKCVIFGCGYVGVTFAQQAVRLGYQVTALTRNRERIEELKILGVRELIQSDLQVDHWHERLKGSYDFVLNTVSSAGNGMEGYRKSYLEGQKSIANWLKSKEVQVGTWIFTGSTSVYPQSGDQVVTENASHEGVGESGEILLQAEEVMKANEDLVDRWFIARLAGIYGPSRHHLLDQLQEGNREFAGACQHFVNYIHRDDICSALWKIVDSVPQNKNKIYNISDGNPSRKKELITWLATQLSFKEEITFNPDKVFSKRRLLFNGEVPSRKISPARIIKELDWEPTFPTFREGYEAILKSV